MNHARFRRRDFLGMTLAGVGLPAWLRVPAGASPARGGAEPLPGLWDYLKHPVKARNPDVHGGWYDIAQAAFDGYGGSLRPDSVAHCWVQGGHPSGQNPFTCSMDFGEPVAVSKFVHYFYIPQVKDYRPSPLLLSSAFHSLRVYRSRDGVDWELADSLQNLPSDWPQVLVLSEPTPARHYRIEVTGLVPGAEGIRTYEIESYTGPAIQAFDAAEHPKLGEQFVLSGRVVGAERPEQHMVRLTASADFAASELAVAPEPSGRLALRLTAHRTGNLPVTLELRSSENVLLDRRSITLQVHPRVQVTDVRAEGDAVVGQLSNSTTKRLSVRVSAGSPTAVGDLPPGAEGRFRLADAARHARGRAVVIETEEDSKFHARWRFPVGSPVREGRGELSNDEIKIGWAAEEARLRLELFPKGTAAPIRAVLELYYNERPTSLAVVENLSDEVVFSAAHEHGSIECTVMLAGSGLRAVFRNFWNGWQGDDHTPGVLGVRLRADEVKFRFVPEHVYSDEPVSEFVGGLWRSVPGAGSVVRADAHGGAPDTSRQRGPRA